MSIITILGSINMDLVTQVDHIPKVGETILGTNFKQIPGGKGANQAVAAARLGANVQMIGKVGNDTNGELLKTELKSNHVGTKHINNTSQDTTGIALITVEKSGNNSIVVISGANDLLQPIDVDSAMEELEETKILVSQLEVPIDTVQYAFKLAKSRGIFTILNPAPAKKLDKEFIQYIDLLTPNETELELLSGVSIHSEEDIIKAANVLIDIGIKQLIVTLGEKGCMYIDENGNKKYKSHKVDAIDTTAAGDSFTAAIAVSLNEGKTIDESINFASRVGALTVSKFGAQSSLPYRTDVDKFEGAKCE